MKRVILDSTTAMAAIAALVLIVFSGCASAPPHNAPEAITVEGQVTARGQAPFSEHVLETAEGNLYVLQFGDETSATIPTPTRIRVTGKLYSDDWDGRPFAHVQVEEWERAP